MKVSLCFQTLLYEDVCLTAPAQQFPIPLKCTRQTNQPPATDNLPQDTDNLPQDTEHPTVPLVTLSDPDDTSHFGYITTHLITMIDMVIDQLQVKCRVSAITTNGK